MGTNAMSRKWNAPKILHLTNQIVRYCNFWARSIFGANIASQRLRRLQLVTTSKIGSSKANDFIFILSFIVQRKIRLN